jgi:opacity protein-like surface antigen
MKLSVRLFQYSVALVGLMALTITPSSSQEILVLGGGIGLLIPASGFGGSTLDYYSGSRYGLSSGPAFHALAKIRFSAWSIASEVDYAALRNTGHSEPGQGTIDLSQKILSFKVGPEFQIGIPVLPVTSYVGINVALNRFSGETTFQGVANVPSGTYSVNPETRIGLGLAAGTEIAVSRLLSVDFNISYNLMNFAGRTWDSGTPESNKRIDSYLSLNDNADPQYAIGDTRHFVGGERSMHSLQFNASILFGL